MKMTEKKISELQKKYRKFFLKKLEFFGVKSPAELTKEKKSEFFTSIKHDWTKIKQKKPIFPEVEIETVANTDKIKFGAKIRPNIGKHGQSPNSTTPETKPEIADRERNHFQVATKQIIKSEPNKEQADNLKIQYTPNLYFEQGDNYLYPVVKMPQANSVLNLPRNGRSNQKGYKENDFFNEIKEQITDIERTDNVHMVIPNYNKPYEPDIVLFDKKINLYIDIEIDEPYDGYYRYPTHCIRQEEEQKQDNVRDLFFTESGWVVMRFTEKQVHLQSKECIEYIRNVLNCLYNRSFNNNAICEMEEQWDDNQCVKWEKEHYREKYLAIDSFYKRQNIKEIEIDTGINESIEKVIQRTRRFSFKTWNSSVAFDEESHKYIHPKDETGNAEYLSVTTIIERFFPFDLKRYIEKKAKDENRDEEDVLDDFLIMRDEAAGKGTYLHSQIENYLKGNKFDSETKEFQLFLSFYNKEIRKRNLHFFDAEKMIISEKYNVAGTIDCLFKKNDRDEYVMLDWKRSKKLIIDGRPRIFGFGYALSELNTLDNSSFYRYCLQQNIYKCIVEKEYFTPCGDKFPKD